VLSSESGKLAISKITTMKIKHLEIQCFSSDAEVGPAPPDDGGGVRHPFQYVQPLPSGNVYECGAINLVATMRAGWNSR
jgi:hypothetical protein